jgi:hypothetical protein
VAFWLKAGRRTGSAIRDWAKSGWCKEYVHGTYLACGSGSQRGSKVSKAGSDQLAFCNTLGLTVVHPSMVPCSSDSLKAHAGVDIAFNLSSSKSTKKT